MVELTHKLTQPPYPPKQGARTSPYIFSEKTKSQPDIFLNYEINYYLLL